MFICVCEFICPVEARKGVDTPGNEITGSSKHPDMGAESHTDVSSEGAVDTLTHWVIGSLYCLGYFAIKLGILPLQMDS